MHLISFRIFSLIIYWLINANDVVIKTVLMSKRFNLHTDMPGASTSNISIKLNAIEWKWKVFIKSLQIHHYIDYVLILFIEHKIETIIKVSSVKFWSLSKNVDLIFIVSFFIWSFLTFPFSWIPICFESLIFVAEWKKNQI